MTDEFRVSRWLSAGQTANALGVSTTRVMQLRRSRELPGRSTPLGYFYQRADVARLKRARARAGARKPSRVRVAS